MLNPTVINPSDSRATNTTEVKCVYNGLVNRGVTFTSVKLCNSFLLAKGNRNAPRTLVTNLLNVRPSSREVPVTFRVTRGRNLGFAINRTGLGRTRPGSILLGLGNGDNGELRVVNRSVNNSVVGVTRVSNLPTGVSNSCPALVTDGVSIPKVITGISTILCRTGVGVTRVRLCETSHKGGSILVTRYSRRVPTRAVGRVTSVDNVIGISCLDLRS